jgi:hypothetical protein
LGVGLFPDVDSEAHEGQGDFYTVEEAAKVLERTPGRIRQLLRDGTLEGEGGGGPKDPLRVHKWSVHDLRDELPRRRGAPITVSLPTPDDAPREARQGAPEPPGGSTEARELRVLWK